MLFVGENAIINGDFQGQERGVNRHGACAKTDLAVIREGVIVEYGVDPAFPDKLDLVLVGPGVPQVCSVEDGVFLAVYKLHGLIQWQVHIARAKLNPDLHLPRVALQILRHQEVFREPRGLAEKANVLL